MCCPRRFWLDALLLGVWIVEIQRMFAGSVAGLRWLRHIPNLRLMQVDGLEDKVAKSVLPKELLYGRPVVCNDDS